MKKYLIPFFALSTNVLWASDKHDILERINRDVHSEPARSMAARDRKIEELDSFFRYERENSELLMAFASALKLPESTRGKIFIVSDRYDDYKKFADDIVKRAAKGVALCQPIAGYAAENFSLLTDLYNHTDHYDLASFQLVRVLLTKETSPAFRVLVVHKKS